MTHKETVDILFFGDLVGKPGRDIVTYYLRNQPDPKPDIVIANVENVTHGFGLSEKHYRELLSAGVNIMTSGNHIWDRKEILDYLPNAREVLRPDNLPAHVPGSGVRIFKIAGVKLGVINLIGQVFMGNYNSPWEHLDGLVTMLKEEAPVIFLDFHAEATSEKIALGRYVAELGVSAMVGTHTHVQTADERIMAGKMGYVTDAGFNGAHDSVIGMEVSGAIQRLRSLLPTRLEVAEASELYQINAVRFTVESNTGVCHAVKRVNEIVHVSQVKTMTALK